MTATKTAAGEITPTERRELRAVVRQQMNVLRAEVKQRAIELSAGVEVRLAERYRDEDSKVTAFQEQLRRVVADANREIETLMGDVMDQFDGGTWRGRPMLSVPHVYRQQEDRDQLRKALLAGIKAQEKSALLDLDRQEADLLRDLAADALETTAARAFLARIPTVAELVPAARLREIENAFDTRGTS